MWHNKKIRPLTRVKQWAPHYGLTGNTHNTFKGLFPFNFTSRITTTAALFLCRTVCYLYQLTEPLHKLNPNIYKLQCVCFLSFFFTLTLSAYCLSGEGSHQIIRLKKGQEISQHGNMTIKRKWKNAGNMIGHLQQTGLQSDVLINHETNITGTSGGLTRSDWKR